MEHFNRLSPAEDERLALLTEECGEVLQIIGKIQRHGYESSWPEGGPTNRERLSRELGDLLFTIAFLQDQGDISSNILGEYVIRKAEKLNKWFHHNIISDELLDDIREIRNEAGD